MDVIIFSQQTFENIFFFRIEALQPSLLLYYTLLAVLFQLKTNKNIENIIKYFVSLQNNG